MIRLPVAERRFAFALMASAAIHAAALSMILLFASASAPTDLPPVGENFIRAFLVPGTPFTAEKRVSPPGHIPREENRTSPAAAPPKKFPERMAKAVTEIEPFKRAAEIRPPAQPPGTEQETRRLPPTPALPASPASTASAVSLSPSAPTAAASAPGDGSPSGITGRATTKERLEGGESSGATGAAAPPSRRAGVAETLRQGGSASPPAAAVPPRYADNTRPAYPPLARLRGYQGVVLLRVEVLADGRVGRVEISHSAGHEVLDRAALESVRSWRFEPGRREGRAVTMSVEVPVRFVLNEDLSG